MDHVAVSAEPAEKPFSLGIDRSSFVDARRSPVDASGAFVGLPAVANIV
jgi:hypothetical protein